MCNLTDHLESSKMEIKKPALENVKTHGKRVRTGLEKKENKKILNTEQKMGNSIVSINI
jgi:hypothetical protein